MRLMNKLQHIKQFVDKICAEDGKKKKKSQTK